MTWIQPDSLSLNRIIQLGCKLVANSHQIGATLHATDFLALVQLNSNCNSVGLLISDDLFPMMDFTLQGMLCPFGL